MSQQEPEKPGKHYVIRQESDHPRGDLYELEYVTHYHVVDLICGDILITLDGFMQEHLDRDSGLWDEPEFWGAKEVLVSPDESAILVRNYDGKEFFFTLRQDSDHSLDLL